MIKKIQSIKNYGVFKNFIWGNQMPEFKEKNIIYGWNYTGKTTLSRIFSSIKNKQLHPKFQEGEFKLLLADNSELKYSDIQSNSLNIEVFNSEYIRENLKWETDEKVNGISFDVGENVTIREELIKNSKVIESINGNETIRGRKENYQGIINEFKQYDSTKFTIESRRIKNDIFNSLIEFDKSHFGKIKTSIIGNLNEQIISDTVNLGRVKLIAVTTNRKKRIENIKFNSVNENLFEKAKDILKAEPIQSNGNNDLDSNSKNYYWVKDGIPLHDSLEKCLFCDNELGANRIKELNIYFSNASAKIRDAIKHCRMLIDMELMSINTLKMPSSKNDFHDNFQSDIQNLFDSYESIKQKFINYLNGLVQELERKDNGNIFISLEIKEIDKSCIDELEEWIRNSNQIIDSHNNFEENFEKEQDNARSKLKKHLVAEFLLQENYIEKENAKIFSERCIKRYESLIQKINKQNNQLEAQLKSVVKGQEELDKFIKIILNRDDIKIEVTEDDKFVLKRGGNVAENFSEGEKTAISFSYFLVTLESLHRDKKLKDYIVFIDDPISSLDGNHIAQVYSLLNSFFFRQNENPNDLKEWVSCFKQLFISTHNFDFFSFLKDSNRINKKNTKEYFFIKRISNDESEIQTLPKSLREYKSEYIYLFEIIYNFFQAGCQESEEKLILMPNAVRRFLEIYTLFKLPDSTDEVDARLKILMPESNQLKTLHHFSHFTTFEKVTKHDELLMNLPEAIKELITLLEKDPFHLDSLKKAIQSAKN